MLLQHFIPTRARSVSRDDNIVGEDPESKHEMRAMNLIATLLLSLALMQGIASSQRSRRSEYTCRYLDSLENCQNNPRIRVTKDTRSYNVRVCTTEDCSAGMPDADFDWIRCNSICSACNALMPPGKITHSSITAPLTCTHCSTPLDVTSMKQDAVNPSIKCPRIRSYK